MGLAGLGLAGLALATMPASAETFRALGSVTSPPQYVGDSVGTTFRVAVDNTNATLSVGAVSVAAPSGWRIVSCPAGPLGWSRSLVAGQCRFTSPAGSAGDLRPHTVSSSFAVRATTQSSATDLVGRWTVRAYRASAITGTPAVASPGASSMVTHAYSLQVQRVLVADAPATGTTCPAAAGTAPAGSLRTLVVCAVNRSSSALTPVFDHSRLTGTFASGGTYRSNPASAGPAATFLSSWRDSTVLSAGAGKTVGVRLGTNAGQSSPVTTFGGFTSTAPPPPPSPSPPANRAPVAVADSTAAGSDASISIPVLANDSDPDGDVLHIGAVDSTGTVGLVTANADGTVTYDARGRFATLAPGTSTTDTFRYTAADAAAQSTPAVVTITVTAPPPPPGPVNQAPVVVTDAGPASYTENTAAVVVSPGLTVSDADSANLTGGTVAIGLGFRTGRDVLGFVDTATVSGSYNTTTGVLTLTGTAPPADYQAALRTVTFLAGGNDPGSSSRTVSFVVNDGNANSTTASRSVAVTPVNDPPLVSMTGTPLAYTEGSAPPLDGGLVVSDPDSVNLHGAALTISSNYTPADGDALSFANTPNITGSFNSSTGALTLIGNDTLAAYQAALRSVTFSTASDNPSTATRLVSMQVADDSFAASNVASRQISVTALNDAPGVSTTAGSTAYTEGAAATTIDANLTVVDVDDVNLEAAQVRISAGLQAGDSLTVAGQPGLVASGLGTGVLTLTGTATTAAYQAALRAVQYQTTNTNPSASKTVEFLVSDGDTTSSPATKSLAITAVNSSPVADDEAFNNVLGNTTFVVNDPDDAAPATPDPTDGTPGADRPHATVTGDILAGDTDADGNPLSVVAGTFATNGGGTVMLEADGDFVFDPAFTSSCAAPTDFFDYTVSDGAGGTDVGRVTINMNGCIVYVNNDDAQGNNGTSAKPFDTLAQAAANTPAGETIFVYGGDGTSTGYNAGITLKSGQWLIGEATTLTGLHAADPSSRPLLTNNGAAVVIVDGGRVAGVRIDPQGNGAGIRAGTGNGPTIDDVQIIDTGVAGTAGGINLNDLGGTTTISNFVFDNTVATGATSGSVGMRLVSNGVTPLAVNLVPTGTISITAKGAKGLDATLVNFGAGSVVDDITVTGSGSGGVSLLSDTGVLTLGDGVGTDLSLTTTSGGSPALDIASSGTISVPAGGTANLNATGGPALIITGTPGASLPFDAVSSTNSATAGIALYDLGTGTFSATSGSIGGAAGIGFDLFGGSGAITYPGTFNNGSGTTAIEVKGRTGGVVSLSGSINDTNDAGGGVSLSSNTGGSTVLSGATKQFNTGASDAVTFSNSDGHTLVLAGGGTDIDTTSGNGISATTSGTFEVSGTGNTLDATALSAGNRGMNVVDTDFAAADVTFDHISTNGGANGILLNNTGTVGNLVVTGTGGTCTAADTSGCSGGTIQNAAGSDDSSASPVGTGIALKSTRDTSLTRLRITNNSNYGIRGDSIGGGFTLANSVLDGANGSETSAGAGSPFNEAAMRFTELTGSNAIINSAISGGASDNLAVINTSGSLNRLTISGTTFGNNSNTQGFSSVDVEGGGTATMNVTLDSNTFTASRNTYINLISGGTAGDFVVTNNNISQSRPTAGPNAPAAGSGDILVVGAAAAHTTFNVAGNTMTGSTGDAVLFAHDSVAAGGTFTGTANNNTIGVAGTANSGSLAGSGINLNRTGGSSAGSTSVAITNNTIRQYNNFGIILQSGSGGLASDAGSVHATVTGNTISNPGSGAGVFQGIQLNSGTTPGQSFQWCANVKANSIIGSGRNGGTDFRLRQRQSTTVRLPGYGGTAFDTTAVTNFIASQNDANPNSAGAEPPTPTGAAVTDAGGGFVGGAACSSG